MKCNAYVIYKDAKKKGSGEPYKKAVLISTKYQEELIHESLLKEKYIIELKEKISKAVYCDGDVEVTVKINYGPHRDDEDVEVEYKCNKCGNTFFPELEDFGYRSEEGEFLTDAVAHYPEYKRKERLKEKIKKEKEREKK